MRRINLKDGEDNKAGFKMDLRLSRKVIFWGLCLTLVLALAMTCNANAQTIQETMKQVVEETAGELGSRGGKYSATADGGWTCKDYEKGLLLALDVSEEHSRYDGYCMMVDKGETRFDSQTGSIVDISWEGISCFIGRFKFTIALNAQKRNATDDELKKMKEEFLEKAKEHGLLLTLQASKDGYASGVQEVENSENFEVITISGKITNKETGEPIGNATVEIIEGADYDSTITDAHGEYAISAFIRHNRFF